MSNPPSRLRNILGHLIGGSPQTQESSPAQDDYTHTHHIHQLSPTFFLERAAAIEPDAEAIYHVTANGRILRRSYIEFADRARGLAYYLVKHGFKRVGVLAPNTPAFLESIYGIVAGGGVIVPVNYRLKQEDIAYIFDFAEVDVIVVDAEFVHLLDLYKKKHARTPVIIDNVSIELPRANCVAVANRNRTRMLQRESSAALLTMPSWKVSTTIAKTGPKAGQGCHRLSMRTTCLPSPSPPARLLNPKASSTPIEEPTSPLLQT